MLHRNVPSGISSNLIGVSVVLLIIGCNVSKEDLGGVTKVFPMVKLVTRMMWEEVDLNHWKRVRVRERVYPLQT